MRLLRLTTHALQKRQAEELRKIFGNDLKIDQKYVEFKNGIVEKFDKIAEGYDIVEVVLPEMLIERILRESRFCRNGGMLIRARMKRVWYEHKGRKRVSWKFLYYEHLRNVVIDSVRLVSDSK